ncbi:MAG: hypothetical protein IJI16_05210 [Atopobiaceae bacterium]|nr:hypothetical protein [Atopobiaceae bacterium]MBQ3282814.1 hypothetical protein [Atopobiaceae bacterium]MBQ6411330.1 hypothetical protein [Atopobiaceae bacterium]MBQ6651619.1 hypothetical protein [Atopobiaceae bacterium]
MADETYNDRALTEADDATLPKPQIEIIVDGESVFKPGMKTYFIDGYSEETGQFSSSVMGAYCSCDTVSASYMVCTCEHVCTCESVCSCVGYSTCACVGNVTSGGGGGWVSCGSPCACVPVH